MKLQDIMEAIVTLDDDDEEIGYKPFVLPTKGRKALTGEQKRRFMTDKGSSAIAADTDPDVKRSAEFVRNLMISAYSGRERTTFDPITYEAKGIRIKVALSQESKGTERERDNLDALAEYLGWEGGVSLSRDHRHVYIVAQPFRLAKWMDDEFPTTIAELSGEDKGREYDPYALKKIKAKAKAEQPTVEPEAPKRPMRRVTKDQQRQDEIDRAQRAKDSQLAWEFERSRKERERQAQAAQAVADREERKRAVVKTQEELDKQSRERSRGKGWLRTR